jgi:hypothetical protein
MKIACMLVYARSVPLLPSLCTSSCRPSQNVNGSPGVIHINNEKMIGVTNDVNEGPQWTRTLDWQEKPSSKPWKNVQFKAIFVFFIEFA